MTEATPTRTEKTLLKLRNKAYSTLSIKAISDALVVMGYEVERSGRGDSAELTITTPDGETTKTFSGRVRDYELAGWLFKETSADSLAAAALGMPTVEDAKRDREGKTRDWRNTGTCPCCVRNIKLHDGRMVLHGYERPGCGYTIGSCFGVGYEPYERSTKGTEDCRGHFEGIKAGLTELLSQKAQNALLNNLARTAILLVERRDDPSPYYPDHCRRHHARQGGLDAEGRNVMTAEIRNEIIRVANELGEPVTRIEASYSYSVKNQWRWIIKVHHLDRPSTEGRGATLRDAGNDAIKDKQS